MDLPFFILILLLLGIGLIMLFSASYVQAINDTKLTKGDGAFFFKRQGGFALMGVLAMLAASRFDYRKFHYFALPLLALSIVLLIAVLIPGVGVTRNEATRWLNLGVEFQPSEVAKFAEILCFASMITLFGPKKMRTFRYGILPFIAIIGVLAGLLAPEPHLSAIVIIGATGMIMIFLGGANLAWLIGMGVCGVGGVVGLIFLLPHAMARVKVWLDPFSDFRGNGWQGAQSLMSVGSGGVWGLGLGQGRQKHLFLPEPENDFIFAVICEELGMVGCVFIIVMEFLIVYRCFQTARLARSSMDGLICIVFAAMLIFQVIENIGMCLFVMPVIGLPLPFFSYGGSSIVTLYAAMGMVSGVRGRTLPDWLRKT